MNLGAAHRALGPLEGRKTTENAPKGGERAKGMLSPAQYRLQVTLTFSLVDVPRRVHRDASKFP